ncbi:ECF-type sigma factor [Acanthopleuribacter pedis]|uniref:Sigma-70 family RNA polymerase sigma factor n=1 Tax=Acanthopleuribacter pedis TaxID=442870 RepID=A0A8J7Q919_9BACT|nr:ECF-type sigma factor [Acanthopleuribacter pedis]MBO1320821.1 sigma-70 family RNA polymerase sigma factor [Acanthopleuribacter pedis]
MTTNPAVNGNHQPDITHLLQAWHQGDKDALDGVFPLVYADLRRMARHFLRDGARQTLQPTGLVHEMYARLLGSPPSQFENRAHFFNAARMIIRQILVQQSRMRDSIKRGKGMQRQPLEDEEIQAGGDLNLDTLVSIHQCLESFRKLDERKARIVELRFFLGLDISETAEVLNTSERTVRRDWQTAKVWLKRNLKQSA